MFKAKKLITNVNISKLSIKEYKANTSNII